MAGGIFRRDWHPYYAPKLAQLPGAEAAPAPITGTAAGIISQLTGAASGTYGAVGADDLLLEDGQGLLLENGDSLILEGTASLSVTGTAAGSLAPLVGAASGVRGVASLPIGPLLIMQGAESGDMAGMGTVLGTVATTQVQIASGQWAYLFPDDPPTNRCRLTWGARNSFRLSFRLYPTALAVSMDTLVSASPTTNTFGLRLSTPDPLRLAIQISGTGTGTPAINPLLLNQWNDIVWQVAAGDRTKLWVNGTLELDRDISGLTVDATNPDLLLIGFGGGVSYWDDIVASADPYDSSIDGWRVTIPPMGLVGTASGTHGPAIVTGTAAGSIAPLVGAATGTHVPFIGTGVGTVAPLVGTAAATHVPGTGTAAGSIAPLVGAASGTHVPFIGTAAGLRAPLVGAAIGGHGVTGTAAGIVAPLTGNAAASHIPFTGTGVGVRAPLTGSASGVRGVVATATGAVAPLVGASSGVHGAFVVFGNGAGNIAQLTGAAVATHVPFTGTAAGSLAPLVGAASGVRGVASLPIGPLLIMQGAESGDMAGMGTVSGGVAATQVQLASGAWAYRFPSEPPSNRCTITWGARNSYRLSFRLYPTASLVTENITTSSPTANTISLRTGSTDALKLRLILNSSAAGRTTTGDLVLNAWNTIVYQVAAGDRAKLWLNGVLEFDSDISALTIVSTNDAVNLIGFGGGDSYWDDIVASADPYDSSIDGWRVTVPFMGLVGSAVATHVPFIGTAAGTITALAGAASGAHGGAPVTGTAAGSIAPLVGLALGVYGGDLVFGVGTGLIAALLGTAAGVRGVVGSAAAIRLPLAGAALGVHGVVGTAAGTRGVLAGAAAAGHGIAGPAAGSLNPLIGSAAGNIPTGGTAVGGGRLDLAVALDGSASKATSGGAGLQNVTPVLAEEGGKSAAGGAGIQSVTPVLGGQGIKGVEGGAGVQDVTPAIGGRGVKGGVGSAAIALLPEQSAAGTKAVIGGGVLDATPVLVADGFNATIGRGTMVVVPELEGDGSKAAVGDGSLEGLLAFAGSGRGSRSSRAEFAVPLALGGAGRKAATGSGGADVTPILGGEGDNAAQTGPYVQILKASGMVLAVIGLEGRAHAVIAADVNAVIEVELDLAA